MLCPPYLVKAIVRSYIDGLNNRVKAVIDPGKKYVYFPGTEERVIAIQGDKKSIREVVHFVQDKIRNDNDSIGVEGNNWGRNICKLVVANKISVI